LHSAGKKISRGEKLVKFALLFLFGLLFMYIAGLFTLGYIGIRQTGKNQIAQDLEIKRAHEFALGRVIEAQALMG
jgi:biotin transporter BioY